MTIKLEVGKKYILANGEVTSFNKGTRYKYGSTEPYVDPRGLVWAFVTADPHNCHYTPEGECPFLPLRNVVAEYVEPVEYFETVEITRIKLGQFGLVDIIDSTENTLGYRFLNPEDFVTSTPTGTSIDILKETIEILQVIIEFKKLHD